MNQMDKETYIRILRRKLHGIEEEDIEDAISYVSEYFDEAGEGNERIVIDDLGSPSKFAATIKANSATKNLKEDRMDLPKRPHSNVKRIMTVFLGICAMPIALPLLFAVIMLMLAFMLVIFAIGLVGVCGFCALSVVGIPLIIRTFLILDTPGNALVSGGAALLTMGIGILLTLASYQLIRHCIPFAANAVTRLYEKVRGEKRYEKA